MAKIVLTYPDSGLIVNIVVYNGTTIDFTGQAIEVLSTKNYEYSFTEVPGIDYTYTANVIGYNQIGGAVFAETTGGSGGATVSDIWTAQISDYAKTPGTFANKFEQYGGVSHVIEKVGGGGMTEEDKVKLDELFDSISSIKAQLTELQNIKPIPTIVEKEVVRVEKIAIPSIETGTIIEVLVNSLKEINSTLSTIMIKGLLEIKNKK